MHLANTARKMRHGFTLIELLVVISIIALLISILLPALRQAREVGKSIQCLSNQKQLYLGVAMYGDDNDDYCTPSAVTTSVEPKMGPWLYYGGAYVKIWSQLAGDYITTSKVYVLDSGGSYGVDASGRNWPWICPDGVGIPETNPYWGNYAVMTYVAGYREQNNWTDVSIKRLAYIDQAASRFLSMDSGTNGLHYGRVHSPSPPRGYLPGYNPNNIWMGTQERMDDAVNGRHAKTVNAIYVDGHGVGAPPDDVANDVFAWDVPPLP